MGRLKLEWREHGRWVKSGLTFRSETAAIEHMECCGWSTFRIRPVHGKASWKVIK